jgi:hypothetical protein
MRERLRSTIGFKEVDAIPADLASGVLYISYAEQLAVHLCCCGCRRQVVTPLTDEGWTLRLESGGVSMAPSIGNVGLPCESHYWILGCRVEPVIAMSPARIAREHARYRRSVHGRPRTPQSVGSLLTRFVRARFPRPAVGRPRMVDGPGIPRA